MTKTKKQRSYFIPRTDELLLLVISSTAVLWMFFCAFGVRYVQLQPVFWDWLLIAGYMGSIFIAHLVLVAAGSKSDQTILPVVSCLVGIGISYQYRLGYLNLSDWRSVGFISVCAVPLVISSLCVLFRKNRLSWLGKIHWVWVGVAIAIPLVVLLIGVEYRGSYYGPNRTTPTEFIKLALLLAFSGILCKYGNLIDTKVSLFTRESLKAHLGIFLVWVIPQALFILQRDLGIVCISTILLIALLYVATGRFIYWIVSAIAMIAGGWMFKVWVPRGQVRFEAWLEPFNHPADSGYQIIQSLFALFHGEIFGRGIGEGFPSKIPLVNSDFIYASFAEEIGLLGSGLLLFGLMYLSRRAFVIADSAESLFQILVTIGAGTLIWVQVFLNVGGVIKLIPMTGVPLPFISKGGSACLVFAVLLGWIMSVSDS